jgi:NTP pyrophosphatase (non-canonical NTP hydrolase)
MSTLQHFNQLTPAEAERLSLLMEECGEVIQIIGKIQRHGYSSSHPDNPGVSNATLLAEEIGHVIAAKELILCAGDISALRVSNSYEAKTRGYQSKKYLHHQ